MRGGDSTKRIYCRKSQSTLGAVPASELMNIEIDDLPDVVLVEILCRLPCYKFVSKCKCVSKRWCNVMSGPYFLGRFLRLQSDREQTPIIRTLITNRGEEFLTRMSSSTKPLALLFERLMSSHHLEQEPAVVATYNDLVLCCTTGDYYQRDYYICNPCTIQWVPVPPPPRVYRYTPVGFICDLPYYSCTKDDQGGSFIQVNAEYRCRIVRLILRKRSVSKLKVQIFSSDTGEWITSTISIPSGFISDTVPLERSFSYNGMLYFVGDEAGDQNFLMGLDPFMINNSNSALSLSSTSLNSTNGDDIIDHYKCRFIRFDDPDSFILRYLGEYRGCLHMCDYHYHTSTFFVRELKEEEMHGGAGKLCLEGMMKDYSLDIKMVLGYDIVDLQFLDPNNEDILYMYVGKDIVRYNIQTRDWLKLVENIPYRNSFLFPIVLPWWPTPVPRLPPHAQSAGINL
ncbi:hypothetical protein ABKV19_010371 [Rosa sericea]